MTTNEVPQIFLDIERDWRPDDVVLEEELTPLGSELFGAILDQPSPVREAGDPLPPMWHWFSFLPVHAQGQLGDDGHPDAGEFLPPLPRRRRMFGGSRLEIRAPLRCGDRAVRLSALDKVRTVQGQSGPLLIATVRHEISVGGEVRLVEEQDHVYRRAEDMGTTVPPTAGDGDAPPPSDLSLALSPDPVHLFRFSCVTGNAHRIHYDVGYTTEVEGYPGLVVHGPLLALLLLELPRRAGLEVAAFRWRALAPTFVGETVHALGWRRGDVLDLQIGAAGAWDRVTGVAHLAPNPASRRSDRVR